MRRKELGRICAAPVADNRVEDDWPAEMRDRGRKRDERRATIEGEWNKIREQGMSIGRDDAI